MTWFESPFQGWPAVREKRHRPRQPDRAPGRSEPVRVLLRGRDAPVFATQSQEPRSIWSRRLNATRGTGARLTGVTAGCCRYAKVLPSPSIHGPKMSSGVLAVMVPNLLLLT